MKRLAFALLVSMSLTGCGLELGYPIGGGAGSSTQDPNAANYRMFVSNTGTQGNTTVLSADNICSTDQARQGASGRFLALMVDGPTRSVLPTNTSWVLVAGRQYIRMDGTFIGTAISPGILPASLNNAISDSPNTVWTGLGSGWSTSTSLCNNWSSNVAGVVGAVGSAGSTNQYYSNSTADCSGYLHIICVEQ